MTGAGMCFTVTVRLDGEAIWDAVRAELVLRGLDQRKRENPDDDKREG